MVSVHAILGVGRQQDWADILDPRGIGWHELLPADPLPGVQIEAIDASRQFTGLVDIQGAAV